MSFSPTYGMVLYWPIPQPPHALTPAEAWAALLAGSIDADEFGQVLEAWERVA